MYSHIFTYLFTGPYNYQQQIIQIVEERSLEMENTRRKTGMV